MREYGVRRYGDAVYHHCLADSPEDAANWYAHAQAGLAKKDFQALVKDVSQPVTEGPDGSGNPSVVSVRHGPPTPGAMAAKGLGSTSPLK